MRKRSGWRPCHPAWQDRFIVPQEQKQSVFLVSAVSHSRAMEHAIEPDRHCTLLYHHVHGKGTPLLWVHGFMGAGEDWRHVFPDVPPGFRLIAPDLRGHGASPPAPEVFSFRRCGRDLLSLLDHSGIERACGIGLSGGGIALLHAAAVAPERIGPMVLVSVPRRFPEQARAIQRQYSPAMLSEHEMAMLRRRHRDEEQIQRLFAHARAMAEDEEDVNFGADVLARIAAHTLIVFGDRDPLYPVSSAVELFEALPRAALWIRPEAGHGPVFADQAPLFRDVALAFLRRHGAGNET